MCKYTKKYSTFIKKREKNAKIIIKMSKKIKSKGIHSFGNVPLGETIINTLCNSLQ